MGAAAGVGWLTRRRTVVLGMAGAAVVSLVLVIGLSTMAWGNDLRANQRLLPGTAVAGVDVGGLTVSDAAAALEQVIDDDLGRPLQVTDGDRAWTTTARDLGATSNLEQVVGEALDRTTTANLVDLARLRFGPARALELDVELELDPDAVAAFVAGMARTVDTTPQDAVLGWVDGRADVAEAVTGRQVERGDAARAVAAAIAARAATVSLPVEETAPDFGTAEATRIADGVDKAVRSALDHEVTVTIEDTTRTVTARELGATHNAAELLAARDVAPGPVVLDLDEDRVHEVVDEVVEPHEVPARNASLDWSPAGGFAATPGQTGLAVDHPEAIEALTAALQDGRDTLAYELHTTHPSITLDSFGQVLLVRQAERRVELYRGGQVVRSWPVAIGQARYPTPTGMFTIGAKRFEPTWHNSSPESWGADLPDVVPPGPNNPLGLRALNWMDGPVDTLIRFHGTSNESSIGRAASHGCVRMLNPDVIELFDLVDTGTVIVSVDA